MESPYTEKDIDRMDALYQELSLVMPLRQPEHPALLAAWGKAHVLVQNAIAALEEPFAEEREALARGETVKRPL